MVLPVFVICVLCLMAGAMVILPEVLCGSLQVFQAFARSTLNQATAPFFCIRSSVHFTI